MKKYFDKQNSSIIIMVSSSILLVVLLMITTILKVGNDTKLFQKEATIYTSAKEYTPTKIANVYTVEPEKPKEEVKEENVEEQPETQVEVEEKIEEPAVVERNVVYDNMTIEELSDKLNRSLNSNVSGYGNLFATYSLEKGVDPYIAVAIMLHETGCAGNCSNLVRNCNNVGGQKGSPSCGGAYKYYPTLEEGIKGYIDNLSGNYFAKGLNTPETMARKYTGHSGTEWVSRVNNYIQNIKVK